MPSSGKRTNTLCVISFLIVILGIGLYCIFKPPSQQEQIQTLPESQIRTSIEDLTPRYNNIKDPPLRGAPQGLSNKDDYIELINT